MNQFERLFLVSGLSLDRLRTFLRVVETGSLSKAAAGDPTKQSQFSRQIKELEAYFGAALTRRVGRRIEITEDGRQLGLIIRRQLGELDDFREATAGRSVSVRVGSQSSVIDWLLLPRLEGMVRALGKVTVELEQMRSSEVVRAVGDGRLDLGVVREDAVIPGTPKWSLGAVGYSVFASKSLWRKGSSVQDIVREVPFVELITGGQFSMRWQEWVAREKLQPRVVARVSSFTNVMHAIAAGHVAGVLPSFAAVDFDSKKFKHLLIPELEPRKLVWIANARSLERAGIARDVAAKLSELLKLG